MDNHQRLLSEALDALEDRWVRIDDHQGRTDAAYAIIFPLAKRSVIAALAFNTSWLRMRESQLPTAPGFLQLLKAEAQSDLASRLIALDEIAGQSSSAHGSHDTKPARRL